MMNAKLPIPLENLLHHRTVKTSWLDIKSTWNHAVAAAVVRTVSAFANDLHSLGGGYLVLGVQTEGGWPILPPRGLASWDPEVLGRKIQAACLKIKPTYQPRIFAVQMYDRPLVILHCPVGAQRPYEAPGRNKSYAFYARFGSQTIMAKGDILRQLHQLPSFGLTKSQRHITCDR